MGLKERNLHLLCLLCCTLGCLVYLILLIILSQVRKQRHRNSVHLPQTTQPGMEPGLIDLDFGQMDFESAPGGLRAGAFRVAESW